MTDRLVIDNSVIMAWCFRDVGDGYADAVLSSLVDAEALVPGIWPLEVANVLVAAERRGRLKETDSTRFLALLADLPLRVIQESPQRITGEILALARETGLSSYDASYLDLAMREGEPLATLDEGLRKAAAKVGVELFQEEGKG
ncbi:type II toxin-antitoxin system VapC family toxin [Geoalkalibacter halelectricus]|uniref:Ribonuclease VapC n=1 Tax=Geoalkalibacter halelectricus TaxID=2847045 RepID=A0ABY5ZMM0_9BACT|nr:type II toxin-antitoxin system VapC family toxin [Geoalkalibacter halelectricus]MDO3378577.1 type II toxin-antitoxin system VapC family toxin [Geoalkalibacter halelectricus]UWZ80109.1 type II toxin-antitoxin system VapC family toxin [Geoalkalibacter halelectricus]